jgi:DNA (cytosine-5)-methyltransferase 1
MDEYAELEFIDEPIYIHGSPPLRIGTDCSGIEAPIQALRQLGIPHRHVWSSDIDKFCIQSIKANYEPERLYGDPNGPYPGGDITNRDNSTLPDIDLYICGFPCQPFSTAGQRKGFEDKRGNVFWSCLDVIKLKQPKYFILENVKGLLCHDKENKKDKYGRTWSIIWNEIQGLEEFGYNVKWKVMNTRDYGIPQNRERVYIVGVKEKDFKWPEKIEMDDIKKYIDWNDSVIKIPSVNCEEMIRNIRCKPIYINIGFPNNSHESSHIFCPTLTTSSNQIWNVTKQRYANIKEFLMLQGFNPLFRQIISNTQTRKQIGNSMSVNVLKVIMNCII